MRFPPSILDEIRARLPVSAVVGRRVKLVKSGREYRGLSPFNSEKTPSFYVNDQKGFYHCFSSGKHGDIFRFVMETEGVTFPEAVERLANEAGVALPQMTPEAEEREASRKGLHEVLELAAAYYEAQLAGAAGAEARRYLASRDLPSAVQKQFRLGYASADRFALRDHLAGKGVDRQLMIDAGMLISGEDIAVPYDRFRDRVMFPIADRSGRVIAFGGRALAKDAQAKYLNSPETALFHKGATLYNLQAARKAAHERGAVIAVEGYVDVIAMTRAGLAHTVAPLGTALTEDQLGLLWRMAEEPILCFDGDKAGRKAAYRAIDVALPFLAAGKSLRFVFLPEGQDPDDLLRSSGAEAVRAAVDRTLGFADVLWGRELEKEPLDTPERRAGFEKRLRDLVFQIKDETVKRNYLDEFKARLQTINAPRSDHSRRMPGQRSGLGGIYGRNAAQPRAIGSRYPEPNLKTLPLSNSTSLQRSPLLQSRHLAIPQREVALIMGAIHHPSIPLLDIELFAELEFESAEITKLQQGVCDCIAADPGLTSETLQEILISKGLGLVLARVEKLLDPAQAWVLPEAELNHATRAWREAADLQRRVSSLRKDLDLAIAEFDDTEETYERIRHLRERLSAVVSSEDA
ncbi:MAG: DNA primase [Beijerinckiaceae bacterium]|nr:DNA primase [Beijerinckiaceae bacterium]